MAPARELIPVIALKKLSIYLEFYKELTNLERWTSVWTHQKRSHRQDAAWPR